MDLAEIPCWGNWANNAELMADVQTLGFLDDDHPVWDATYGMGTFWKLRRPAMLFGSDLHPGKGVATIDFTDSGFADRQWHSVIFDPPYKLNGTPDPEVDEIYGVDTYTRWQDRMELIRAGVEECARVTGDGYLLVKCMNQVSSGKVRWQTDLVAEAAKGFGKVCEFNMPTGRPQPMGRRQVHPRNNVSTLMILKRGW